MMKLLRYWWRGWSDDDMQSILAKLDVNHVPGGMIKTTLGELNALRSYYRERG